MLRDPLAWLLYSPRRLISAVVVAAVCTVVGVLTIDEKEQDPVSARPTNVATSSLPPKARAVSRSDGTEKPADPAAIRQTARRFLHHYVIAPGATSPKAVPSSLRNVTTPTLWQGLQLTQPDRLPRGSLESITVDGVGPVSGTVTAALDSGIALNVSLVAWQKGWRVSDVRPADEP
jgi:hypothetical protein